MDYVRGDGDGGVMIIYLELGGVGKQANLLYKYAIATLH